VSTTSTIITIFICAVLVAAIGYALVKGIWSAAKKITVPIQIALFVVMLVCVGRLFCTKENAKKLYDGIEQTGISRNVENTMRTALNMKPVAVSKPEAKPVQIAVAQTATEPDGSSVAISGTVPIESTDSEPVSKQAPKAVPVSTVVKAKTQTIEASAPAVVNVEVKVTPDPQPNIKPEPAPTKASDYSHLNRGKKSFTYALPVNATVTVSFKDNTYRVISESLCSMNAAEKKEVGKLIFTSLGKYAGKTIDSWDKSKISIESRYDESDGHTRVFAIIPPEALD